MTAKVYVDVLVVFSREGELMKHKGIEKYR